jgi:hypothetical protein
MGQNGEMNDAIECPLCCGAGKLKRTEILDRLGVRDFARVAQLSAEEAFRLLQQKHNHDQQSVWSRFETELAKRTAEIRERHKDELRTSQSQRDGLIRRVEDCLREVAQVQERNQQLEAEMAKIARVGKREEMDFAEEARTWAGIAVSEKLSKERRLHLGLPRLAGLQGQFARRLEEWNFQLQSANDEITQINAQISAAQFRLAMAQEDQSNLNLQIQNAQAVQNFLTSRYTNAQLYSWMVDQISTVFFQCYQMAYDLATQAEAAFRFERGLTTSSYIQFGYWDSLKKGITEVRTYFQCRTRCENRASVGK